MDQNQNQYQYQTPRRRSYAADFRARARTALSGNWATAIGIFLLAGILGGVAGSVYFNFSFNIRSFNFQDFVQTVQNNRFGMDSDVLLDRIRNFFETNPFRPFLLLIVSGFMLFAVARNLFLGSPVILGYERYNLNLIDGKPDHAISTLFRYFSVCYWKSIVLNILYSLLIVLIGGIPIAISVIVFLSLLAFGGMGIANVVLAMLCLTVLMTLTTIFLIYVEYSYIFSFMILAEYPNLRPVDAMRNSRLLMRGNKWRLFCLQCSFIGWFLLATFCTCGIGILWVTPYSRAAQTAFYDEISNRAQARETEFPSINLDDYNLGTKS